MERSLSEDRRAGRLQLKFRWVEDAQQLVGPHRYHFDEGTGDRLYGLPRLLPVWRTQESRRRQVCQASKFQSEDKKDEM